MCIDCLYISSDPQQWPGSLQDLQSHLKISEMPWSHPVNKYLLIQPRTRDCSSENCQTRPMDQRETSGLKMIDDGALMIAPLKYRALQLTQFLLGQTHSGVPSEFSQEAPIQLQYGMFPRTMLPKAYSTCLLNDSDRGWPECWSKQKLETHSLAPVEHLQSIIENAGVPQTFSSNS